MQFLSPDFPANYTMSNIIMEYNNPFRGTASICARPSMNKHNNVYVAIGCAVIIAQCVWDRQDAPALGYTYMVAGALIKR